MGVCNTARTFGLYFNLNLFLFNLGLLGEPRQVSLSEEADGKPMLHKWEDKYVILLIDKYTKSKHLFKKPRVLKKEVFEIIAQHTQ